MPDDRQKLLDEAAQALREAGCSVVSIFATWADGELKTSISYEYKSLSKVVGE